MTPELNFDPTQRRVPAGSSEGGRFASKGGAPSGGDDPELPAAVLVRLMEAEAGMVGLDHERAVIVDLGGTVLLSKDGGRNYVGFTAAETSGISVGSVLTHNHLNGSSFSYDDAGFAVSRGLKEIRAVTEKHVHRLRPGNAGWPSIQELKETYRREYDELDRKTRAALREGTISLAEANEGHFHQTWTVVASKLPDRLRYERTRRQDAGAS